jgi:site-specific recombinase XerD
MPINEDIINQLLSKVDNIESILRPQLPKMDFAAESYAHIEDLKTTGRENTACSYKRSLDRFLKFVKMSQIDICEIKKPLILSFYEHLRNTVSLDCAKAYCVDLRVLYNYCTRYLDTAPNPFKNINLRRQLRRRSRSLTASDILKIYNAHNLPKNTELARRTFLLSFCLCGINFADLYDMKPPKEGILHYYRKKTASRRDDQAEQYLKLSDTAAAIAAPMVAKSGEYWLDWHERNKQEKSFVKRINNGLKDLAKRLKITVPLSTYYARHSFATIARNDLHIDIFDVAECLNHTPPSNTIDFIYIRKDPMKASRIAEKVQSFVFSSAAVVSGENCLTAC